MGTMLLIIAICMILGAIITTPKLVRMGIRRSARYSFATVAILTAIYFGWVATLFFHDSLGPENYTIELWGVRILLMICSIHFLYSVWRC